MSTVFMTLLFCAFSFVAGPCGAVRCGACAVPSHRVTMELDAHICKCVDTDKRFADEI